MLSQITKREEEKEDEEVSQKDKEKIKDKKKRKKKKWKAREETKLSKLSHRSTLSRAFSDLSWNRQQLVRADAVHPPPLCVHQQNLEVKIKNKKEERKAKRKGGSNEARKKERKKGGKKGRKEARKVGKKEGMIRASATDILGSEVKFKPECKSQKIK